MEMYEGNQRQEDKAEWSVEEEDPFVIKIWLIIPLSAMILVVYVHLQYRTLQSQEGSSVVSLGLLQSKHTRLLFQNPSVIKFQINLNIKSEKKGTQKKTERIGLLLSKEKTPMPAVFGHLNNCGKEEGNNFSPLPQ